MTVKLLPIEAVRSAHSYGFKSDNFTNLESTSFEVVWWLYLFLCTVIVNNNIPFLEKRNQNF